MTALHEHLYRIDNNEKYGSMYILPECIVSIKQKRLRKDAKKNTPGHRVLTKQGKYTLLLCFPSTEVNLLFETIFVLNAFC